MLVMSSLLLLLLALVGLAAAQATTPATYVELTNYLGTDCTGPVYLVRGLRQGE